MLISTLDEDDAMKQIAIVLFPRVTALDAVGPYEVLQRLPGFEVVFVGAQPGQVRTDNGRLGLVADASFEQVPRPDVLIVPGGPGARDLTGEQAVLSWVRQAHESTTWTTSVCTGSLVLGAAGLLRGLSATTQWSADDALAATGATPVAERVVEHAEQRIITAAGVSAGVDMGLRLAALLVDDIAAKAMQLLIEYDPQPPFDSGSVAKSDQATISRAREYGAPRVPR